MRDAVYSRHKSSSSGLERDGTRRIPGFKHDGLEDGALDTIRAECEGEDVSIPRTKAENRDVAIPKRLRIGPGHELKSAALSVVDHEDSTQRGHSEVVEATFDPERAAIEFEERRKDGAYWQHALFDTTGASTIASEIEASERRSSKGPSPEYGDTLSWGVSIAWRLARGSNSRESAHNVYSENEKKTSSCQIGKDPWESWFGPKCRKLFSSTTTSASTISTNTVPMKQPAALDLAPTHFIAFPALPDLSNFEFSATNKVSISANVMPRVFLARDSTPAPAATDRESAPFNSINRFQMDMAAASLGVSLGEGWEPGAVISVPERRKKEEGERRLRMSGNCQPTREEHKEGRQQGRLEPAGWWKPIRNKTKAGLGQAGARPDEGGHVIGPDEGPGESEEPGELGKVG
ncbi:hypothetical protein R3P38DRAFT_3371050 [Favolaschia claudopus]|uniref:Uncharacterized protein n=1 Tax=Favolaschia claudopus TaxID=2862362 RepID=A0AAV9ZZD2_9AGAR